MDEGRDLKKCRECKGPTKAEREEHEVTHYPFRTWCRHCMRGKAKTSPSSAVAGGPERGKPIISIDYAFLGGSRKDHKDIDESEKDAEKKGHSPCLILHDSELKGTLAIAVNRKGADDAAVKKVVDHLDNLGYKEIVLKGDQEPAMTSLMELIKAAWNGDAVLEHSPVGQSQANGAVERAIQSWQGQVRTLKDSLEYKINAKMTPDHDVDCGARKQPAEEMPGRSRRENALREKQRKEEPKTSRADRREGLVFTHAWEKGELWTQSAKKVYSSPSWIAATK